MKMKVFKNSILPFGRHYAAINLFGVLFAKQDAMLDEELLNHERIHTAQMKELLYIPFYFLYVVEWFFLLIRYRGNLYKAYKNISFEREAYKHGSDLSYLTYRRHFSQWR